MYSGAEILIKLLEDFGINIIAGIPGGANLPIYDALANSAIKHVLVRHEQSAGFLAQGMSRSTGKPAVCFATSGPGATNIITAIADAKLDSVPIIIITGQVSSSLIGTDAFQEVDTYGMTIPITKHNFLVKDTKDLLQIIPQAFNIAMSGRPGPVLIDIPKDVQLKKIEVNNWPQIELKKEKTKTDDNQLLKAVKLINESKKPLIFIGGGMLWAESSGMVEILSTKINAPISSTLMGLGIVSCEHTNFLGMVGMHADKFTNKMFREADLIIALGVRFDDRATGKVEDFCPNAKVIHIDVEEAEISKIRKADLGIQSCAGDFLKNLILLVNNRDADNWIEQVWNKKKNILKSNKFGPAEFISSLGKITDEDTIITTDVGQHQMWTAQKFPFRKARTFLTSGGLGTMGFGLPAAMGAALANPDKKIVCISGDGSILMNIQELATLCEENLNVKIIIFNNGHLGLVRQQQELFYNKNYIASQFKRNPDFIKIAKGFGISAIRINCQKKDMKKLKKILALKKPMLIDMKINPNENVYPMVIPGKGNHETMGD